MEPQLQSLVSQSSQDPLTESFASALDAAGGVSRREHFIFPKTGPTSQYRLPGSQSVYLCGNSLGLQPKRTAGYVSEELSKWGEMGVEGHFTQPRPWLTADENVAAGAAALVGALEGECVAMNTLTVNLHVLMCSFYRPTPGRYRILLEEGAFPSDAHVAASQAALHGLDPATTLITLAPRPHDGGVLRTEDILAAIAEAGDTLALVLLPGVQYFTGQLLDIPTITAAARGVGAVAGWDLAHAVGNTPLHLHDWGVDFAAWCTYKYVNGGPGGIAGAFIHERHGAGGEKGRARLAGWWGHTPGDRFLMKSHFNPTPGAQGFQLSNPCVLAIAALRGSLDEFSAGGGMGVLRERSLGLTGYLEVALLASGLFSGGGGGSDGEWSIITPKDASARGAQLSLRYTGEEKGGVKLRDIYHRLTEEGVIVDIREPSVMRVAPAPLYNTAMDVLEFVVTLKKVVAELKAKAK